MWEAIALSQAELKQAELQTDREGHGAPPGGFALASRPSRLVKAVELLALACAGVVAAASADGANWDLGLLATLVAFSIVSDIGAVETASKVKISGSFLALVLAMVFLGGPPAALIGVATIAAGWLRWRDAAHDFLINLVTYSWFPLVGGLGFAHVADAWNVDPNDGLFYLLVLGVFVGALALNFSLIAGYSCYLERSSFAGQVRKLLFPVFSSELAAATMAVGVAFIYSRVDTAAIALFAIVLFTFQYLLGQLLISEERAEELRQRTRQLASLQVGLLSALLHTLDLRDRMTARHSAAVARYAKEIARAAGLSDEEQDLMHTAALLHDVGKFVFPDRILKGDTPLTDDDWKIIRMHPYQGARIVSQIEGYGPVGEIILCHHERIDGKGYPRGITGEDIPVLSRILSVADIYDVMTARDSYREPLTSFEAIRELRRVAGTQVDAEFVEVFIQVLAGKDVRYRHGEDADFDAELALDKRVHDYASPVHGEWEFPDGMLAGIAAQAAEAQEHDSSESAAQDGASGRPSLAQRRSPGSAPE
jgi:putative nucleotidyltransferase with HDIG domain